jgi:hypothetical protein
MVELESEVLMKSAGSVRMAAKDLAKALMVGRPLQAHVAALVAAKEKERGNEPCR